MAVRLGVPENEAEQLGVEVHSGVLVGEVEHDALQLGGEVGQAAVADPADARRAGLASGEDQGRVVGRGVAVDRHRVEGRAHVQAQHGAQHRR